MRHTPGQTWVSTLHVGGTWPEDVSVQGLLLVSSRPRIWYLHDIRAPMITVGRTGHVQIPEDPTLARIQCLIHREGDRVLLSHSYQAENPTTVNGLPVTGEYTVLHAGCLIRGGATRLLVLGPWSPADPLPISAENRLELGVVALAWYGSVSAAARALGIARKTLDRHLRRSNTGRAFLSHEGRRVLRQRALGRVVPRSLVRREDELRWGVKES